MLALRPYQKDIVRGIRQAFLDGFTAPLAVAPTGAGKTVIFSFIAAGSMAKGTRCFIVCHRYRLIKQAGRALTKLGVPYGIIHPKHKPSYGQLVQICSVGSLGNRAAELAAAGIVPFYIVYDEGHHATAGMWRKINEAFPTAKTPDGPGTRTIGVTATPIRTDGQGLGAQHQGGVYDKLIIGPQINWLIENGFLAPADVYAPARMLDLATVNMQSNGDYNVRELEEKVDTATITGDVIASYAKYAEGLPAVAFCVSVAHAQHVAEQFRRAGIPAEAIDGELPDREQERLLKGLENGAIKVLTSCDLISEGFDIPNIACALLLRPTVSLGMYLQQVGRALRLAEGKSRAIVLDFVGNVLRHGMPDEPREWTLDGLVKERKRKGALAPPPRVLECPKCYAAHAPAPACIRCGHVYEVAAPEPEPKVVEGELKHITEAIRSQILSAKELEIAEARTLADLETISKLRNYAPGWASYTYKMRELLRNPELQLTA